MAPSAERSSQRLDFREKRRGHDVQHGIEGSLGAVVAFDAVEPVEAFFPGVEFFKSGVFVEPFPDGKFGEVIESEPAFEKEFSDQERPAITRNFLTVSIQGGMEQTQDMKLVGDQEGSGEEALNKVSIRVG